VGRGGFATRPTIPTEHPRFYLAMKVEGGGVKADSGSSSEVAPRSWRIEFSVSEGAFLSSSRSQLSRTKSEFQRQKGFLMLHVLSVE